MRAIARAVSGSGRTSHIGMKMGGDAGPAILGPTILRGEPHGLRDAGQVQVQAKRLDRPVGKTERKAAVIEWRVVAVNDGVVVGTKHHEVGAVVVAAPAQPNDVVHMADLLRIADPRVELADLATTRIGLAKFGRYPAKLRITSTFQLLHDVADAHVVIGAEKFGVRDLPDDPPVSGIATVEVIDPSLRNITHHSSRDILAKEAGLKDILRVKANPRQCGQPDRERTECLRVRHPQGSDGRCPLE